jgi:hypothetical protein
MSFNDIFYGNNAMAQEKHYTAVDTGSDLFQIVVDLVNKHSALAIIDCLKTLAEIEEEAIEV